MKAITYLLRALILLLNLHLPSREITHLSETIGIQRELNRRKKKEQQKILHRKPWERQRYKKKKLLRHFKNTKPKDHRFSDQRKLRRMYRNS